MLHIPKLWLKDIHSLRKGFLLRSHIPENIENINRFYLVFVKYLASKHIDSYYLQDFFKKIYSNETIYQGSI